ncbi:hypothetical protein K493DRAFT_339863 [Basidiobolus meristosporus CBS 931.73]|uniref:RING-type E3 ubiquitin transferase n=1 Tax=Basidiobolus meristosporus CBS 931.73 TaxID=1314790 RepID=A0A1Y1XY09_9FUNG|nr:hypothetical protein K493DRAFT_339863 [Basidiobolus meristosporus CBS 931.73]|eukprot:ORX90637.1 hypothetical protein K493DRAFT_339863 [Basidiobolus meristosporus CBS 931.73]
MLINIRTSDGNRTSISAEKLDTIASVRQKISTILGKDKYPLHRLRLIYSGKQLENKHKVFDYNVRNNDTILVFLKADIPIEEEETQSESIDHIITPTDSSVSTPISMIPEPIPTKSATSEVTSQIDTPTDEATTGVSLSKDDYVCASCDNNDKKKCKECGCSVCGGKEDEDSTLICEECQMYFHMKCLNPPLKKIPEDDWYCENCFNDPANIIQPGQYIDLSQTRKAKMPSATQKRKWGGGMACAGVEKKCSIVKPNHVGPIPGIPVGSSWKYRIHLSEAGVHRPPVGGIAGSSKTGALSIVLAGGYPEDVDNGDEFFYTGSGGRDLKTGNKRVAEQSEDQVLTRYNLALAKTCDAPIDEKNGAEAKDWRKSTPVRVVRSYKAAKHNPKYAPADGVRYDGIYKLVKYWPQAGYSGFIVWRYLFRRDDQEPAPWTEEGEKRIRDLGLTMYCPPELANKAAASAKSKQKKKPANDKQVIEIKDDSDRDEFQDSVKKPRLSSNDDFGDKHVIVEICKFRPRQEVLDLIAQDVQSQRAWKAVFESRARNMKEFLEIIAEKEFLCPVCQDMVQSPVTTPQCAHSVCKDCLKQSISCLGQMCPMCRTEFNPKLSKDSLSVNTELVAVFKALIPSYGLD